MAKVMEMQGHHQISSTASWASLHLPLIFMLAMKGAINFNSNARDDNYEMSMFNQIESFYYPKSHESSRGEYDAQEYCIITF